MGGQRVKAQQRRGYGEEVAKWEKAAEEVEARGIKDTGEAGENVNTWKLQDRITWTCSLCLPRDQSRKGTGMEWPTCVDTDEGTDLWQV